MNENQSEMINCLIFGFGITFIAGIITYLDLRFNKGKFNKQLDNHLNCSIIKKKRNE